MNANSPIAVIPARLQSKRLPGKPLLRIAGRTLIEHVWQRVARVRGLDRILVATDDARVLEAVRAFGGEAVLTRPDHASGTDRVAEAVADLSDEALIVNVQGDEPLIEPEVIESALRAAQDCEAPIVTVMTRLEDPRQIADPNHVKVVVDRNERALYFSRSPVPSSGTVFLHLGLYVYSAGFLRTFTALEPTPLEQAERLEQLRALEHGYAIRVVEVSSRSWGIDTPADLAAFQRLVEGSGAGTAGEQAGAGQKGVKGIQAGKGIRNG